MFFTIQLHRPQRMSGEDASHACTGNYKRLIAYFVFIAQADYMLHQQRIVLQPIGSVIKINQHNIISFGSNGFQQLRHQAQVVVAIDNVIVYIRVLKTTCKFAPTKRAVTVPLVYRMSVAIQSKVDTFNKNKRLIKHAIST